VDHVNRLDPDAQFAMVREEFVSKISHDSTASAAIRAKLDAASGSRVDWRGYMENVTAVVKFAQFDPSRFSATELLVIHSYPDVLVNLKESGRIADHLAKGGGRVELEQITTGGAHAPFIHHEAQIKSRIAEFLRSRAVNAGETEVERAR